jgi:riboflavin kinase / FMN adenylyltransferase
VRVWNGISEVPAGASRSVVTIGNFDGVHRGHRQVLGQARRVASQMGVDDVVAVTFDPHPFAVLRPEHAPIMLTDMSERAELLGEAGADAVLVLPFDRKVAQWSPHEFIGTVLVTALRASAVVIGANFRFGHRAAGDLNTLIHAGKADDFTVVGVALEGGPQVWSSTYIRNCLAAGDVAGAAEALGRPVVVSGKVEEGDRRGRSLGYPTANVPIAVASTVPADGVYAGWLMRDAADEKLPAAISVGTNPTFPGERARRVEAYVLDREDLDLYGCQVDIEFKTRLRSMVSFTTAVDLAAAMAEDVRRSRAILTGASETELG